MGQTTGGSRRAAHRRATAAKGYPSARCATSRSRELSDRWSVRVLVGRGARIPGGALERLTGEGGAPLWTALEGAG